MKVTYKTHPILKTLHFKKLGKVLVLEEDIPNLVEKGFLDIMSESFKLNCIHFQEIVYISDSFLNASRKAQEKLIELYNDIAVNDTSDLTVKGTFIYKDKVFFLKHILKKGVDFAETSFFAFNKDGKPMGFFETGIEGNECQCAWISKVYSEVFGGGTIDEVREFIYHGLGELVVASLFKSYASVETKYIAPNTKTSKGLKKFRNDTNLGITYLTSKWFTNLVRSEGFKVLGHFRLQPKKVEGEWTKELIWIDQFEKSGYTSRAQILKK